MGDHWKARSLDARFAARFRPYIPTLVVVVGAAGCGYWYGANWRELYNASLLMFAHFGISVDPDLMMGLLASLFFMLGAAGLALAALLRRSQARDLAPSPPP